MSRADRLALVVGIDEYTDAPLTCCANDARDVATALEMTEYGFGTSLLLDGRATRREVLRYLSQLEEARRVRSFSIFPVMVALPLLVPIS